MVSGVFSIPLEAYQSHSNEAGCQGGPRSIEVREYVGSDENRLVYFAVESLLDGSSSYRPIVLYGPTGTGKTLLAQGLADRWRHERRSDRVIATNGADFARSYANAVDTDNLVAFRSKSRSVQLFVLDDVHLLRAKRAAQDELARLLDVLVERRVAILMTALRAPSHDEQLVPALRSRLAAGLSVPLTAPGDSARRVLLRRFADLHDVTLTEEAIELLAGGLAQSSTELPTASTLRHVVLQLGHQSRITNGTVDRDTVLMFLGRQADEKRPSLRLITSKVAKYFSLTVPQLRGPSRRRNIVRARGIAMFLARSMTDHSLEMVGKHFGNRDHTTVLHACRQIESMRSEDPAVASALEELKSQLDGQ